MKKIALSVVIFLAVFLLTVSLTSAQGPGEGLGIFGGFSSSDLEDSGGTIDLSGIALGAEFQIALSDSITVNPFLMIAEEEGDFVDPGFGTINNDLSSTILGAELRFWFDNLFLGPHLAIYDLELTWSASGGQGGSFSDTATGYGGVVGWEGEVGLSVRVFYGISKLESTDNQGNLELDYTTLRVLVGFRF